MSSKLDFLLNQTKESILNKENRTSRHSSQKKISDLRQKFNSLTMKNEMNKRQKKNHLEKIYLDLEDQIEKFGLDNSLNEISCQIEKMCSEIDTMDKKQM
jgi:hypothetical protein